MSGLTTWWTADQLAFAREHRPEAGPFREDRGDGGALGGAYGCNLSAGERDALESIDWPRVRTLGDAYAEKE